MDVKSQRSGRHGTREPWRKTQKGECHLYKRWTPQYNWYLDNNRSRRELKRTGYKQDIFLYTILSQTHQRCTLNHTNKKDEKLVVIKLQIRKKQECNAPTV